MFDSGGAMAPSLFMFERKGSITLRSSRPADEIFDAAVEAGAQDVLDAEPDGVTGLASGEHEHEIVTAPDDLNDVARALRSLGQATSVEHVYVAQEDMRVDVEGRDDIVQLVEMLEDDADVVRVTINAV